MLFATDRILSSLDEFSPGKEQSAQSEIRTPVFSAKKTAAINNLQSNKEFLKRTSMYGKRNFFDYFFYAWLPDPESTAYFLNFMGVQKILISWDYPYKKKAG
jgi:hypothetical protein